MSQEELLKALEDDARREREAILREAEEEARRIVEEAQKELKRLKEEDLLRLKASLSTNRARALNNVEAYSKGLLLETKHSVIKEVFRRVEEELDNLSSREEYPEILRRLLLEALNGMGGGDGAVTFVSKDDLPLLKGVSLPQWLEIKAGDVKLGVIITSMDGRRRVINTLKSRLGKARPGLLHVLSEILF
ncbi:MAG: hypothetical protein HY878_06860 [Deltaproteobacteria bacterium]|nr:hypothetical protein [Deltaproteobacteria bacterium]